MWKEKNLTSCKFCLNFQKTLVRVCIKHYIYELYKLSIEIDINCCNLVKPRHLILLGHNIFKILEFTRKEDCRYQDSLTEKAQKLQ